MVRPALRPAAHADVLTLAVAPGAGAHRPLLGRSRRSLHPPGLHPACRARPARASPLRHPHLPVRCRQVDVVLAAEEQLGHARSEEHTSELQSLMRISYAVFCLTKKITKKPESPT